MRPRKGDDSVLFTPGVNASRSTVCSDTHEPVHRADYLEFAMAFTFRSSSSSTGVILGTNVNDRNCWRDHEERSLNELLERA